MAKFVFKFETVLHQRKTQEDICQRDLAQLLRKRMIFENELRNMQQTITTSKSDMAQSLVGRVDLDKLAQFARYSGQVTQRAMHVVRRMAGLEVEIQQSRQRLVEASRQRKAMEVLRDRHYQAWRRRQDAIETAELDELATQQFLRQHAREVTA